MEMEDPTEHARETIHHHANHSKDMFSSTVAVVTAFFAVLAAICGLLAGQYANEAILEQIEASNNWNYYQAKGVKASVLASKIELMEVLGKPAIKKDEEKLAEYKKDQEEIKKEADEKTKSSNKFLHKHETLAKGVTLFQIAIAVAAISILIKNKLFFALSTVFALIGVVFLTLGLI